MTTQSCFPRLECMLASNLSWGACNGPGACHTVAHVMAGCRPNQLCPPEVYLGGIYCSLCDVPQIVSECPCGIADLFQKWSPFGIRQCHAGEKSTQGQNDAAHLDGNYPGLAFRLRPRLPVVYFDKENQPTDRVKLRPLSGSIKGRHTCEGFSIHVETGLG